MPAKNHEVPQKFNFTKKEIDKLVPPTSRTEDPINGRWQIYYSDSQTRGLELSVAAKGTKSFIYRRKVDGVSRRLFLGYYPDLSIEQARAKANDFNSRCSMGENIFETAGAAKAELTLSDLFNSYLERHAKKSKVTWQVMSKDFERNVASIKNKKLSKISSNIAEKLHVDLTKERGPYSANRTIQLLRAVFNKGIQWKLYRGDNPFKGITLHKEKPRERFLSEDEAKKLLRTLDEMEDCDIKDFIVLSLFTGARKANLAAMHFSNIDWGRGLWVIPISKNGERVVVALGGKEISILERRFNKIKSGLPDDDEPTFVFPGKGSTGHLTDPKKSWYTLRKKAGLEDVTIHDLRRSLGSAMASANVNVALVKGALGHKDMKTTLAHYAHTNKEAERAAKQRIHEQWLAKDEPDENSVARVRKID